MLDNEKKNDIKNSTFLSNYYETLKNFPPLTKEEERVLLKRYKEDNDISARQKLITSNLRYALKYVINYNNKKNVPLEDLIAVLYAVGIAACRPVDGSDRAAHVAAQIV